MARERGDARHALEQVERGALAAEQRAAQAFNGGNHLSRLNALAIGDALRELLVLIQAGQHQPGHFQPGHHAALFGNELAAQARVGRDRALGRHIAIANVLVASAAQRAITSE